MGSNDKATEALRLSQNVVAQIEGVGTAAYAEKSAALLGQNILREEIGYFGDWEGTNYDLSDAEKNRLVAHTRQDVAAIYSLASTAMKAAMAAQKTASRNKTKLNVIIVIQIVTLIVFLSS